MGVGGKACLEPPADGIPIVFALLRRTNDTQKTQEQGESSQILFFSFFLSAWETSHPNRPLAFVNASSPDKSSSLQSAQASCGFPEGLCLPRGKPRSCPGGGGSGSSPASGQWYLWGLSILGTRFNSLLFSWTSLSETWQFPDLNELFFSTFVSQLDPPPSLGSEREK